MPEVKLTPKFVNDITTLKKKEEFQDSVQKGLVLRVTLKGSKNYYFIESIPIPNVAKKKQIQRHIASVEDITLSEARARVKTYLGAYFSQSSDPLFVYTKPKKIRGKLPTIADVYKKWLVCNKKQEKTPKYENMQNGYSILSKNYPATDRKGKEITLVRGLAGLRIDEVSEKKISAWQKDMLEIIGHKPSSVNRVCLELKHLLMFAVDEGLTTDDYQLPKIPKLSEKEIDAKTDYLKSDEIKKLHEGLDEYLRAPHGKYDMQYIKDIILFLLYTGIRPASLCGLQWRDVHFSEEGKEQHPKIILRAANIKTRNTESIVPSDDAIAILKRLYEKNDVPPSPETNVFTTFSADMICRKIKKVLKFIFGDDTKYSAYTLRHTFATHLSLYADLGVVQRAMTHKRITTTMKYVTIDAERVQQAVNRLPFREKEENATENTDKQK